MALSIATNTGALMAAASATSVNKDMETSMERLSTGKRINSASDDAAGVAIASRLTSEIRGTNQAIRNAQDGQALINTAEGAHKEVENILQRMREVAVQSSNDTNDSTDRANLQAEMSALTTEIDRIASTTTWAGQDLLTGAGGVNGTFNLQVGGNTGSGDTISVTIGAMSTAALGRTTASVTAATTAQTVVIGTATAATDKANLTISVTGAADVVITSATVAATASATVVATAIKTAFDAGSFAGYTLSDNGAGQLSLSRADGTNFTSKLSITGTGAISTANATSTDGAVTTANFDISTRALAVAAIGFMDTAISAVNTQRGQLGAVSNRLDNTVSNLTNISINLEGGRGRIEDADFAAESTSLAKSQILQQASTAMLAQANASKQNVLSLLQG
jgi:flagellin